MYKEELLRSFELNGRVYRVIRRTGYTGSVIWMHWDGGAAILAREEDAEAVAAR